MVRIGRGGEAFAVIHTFGGEWPEVIEVPLPEGCPEQVAEVYAAGEADLRIEGRVLRLRPKADWEAVAVRFG